MKMDCKKFFGIISTALLMISAAYSETAVVTFVKGKVEISKNDRWETLKVGDKISTADVISTGFQSEAKVEYNGSVMHLGALTRITLENLSSTKNKDDVSVYLNTGAVRSKVNHTQNKRVSYSVKSPIAVASVRGTDFIVTAGGSVICKEGAVAVYANKDPVKKANVVQRATSEDEESTEKAEDDNVSETNTDTKVEGSATSVTPAEKIDRTAPAGTVVVAKNQEVVIQNNGNPETPLINAIKKTEKVVTSVTTPAVQEAVSVGGTSTVTTTTTTVVEQEPAKVSTGKITTTIVLQD